MNNGMPHTVCVNIIVSKDEVCPVDWNFLWGQVLIWLIFMDYGDGWIVKDDKSGLKLKSVFSCNEGSTNELTNAYVQVLNFKFIGVGEGKDQNHRRQLNVLVNTFRLQHPSPTKMKPNSSKWDFWTYAQHFEPSFNTIELQL